MASSPKKLSLINYVEIQEEFDKVYNLGIGVIEGTETIFIQRYKLIRGEDEDNSNIHYIEKSVEKSVYLEYAWREINKDESIPLADRYIQLLQYNYDSFHTIRNQLHPIIKDFVKPPSSKYGGIYSEEIRNYRDEYYKKRGIYDYDFYSDSDTDNDYDY